MTSKEIVIGRDYAEVPGGRYAKYGPFSGEDFRDNVLVPALRGYDRVTVYLDGAKTYMSSFLEEAFGGLIRVSGIPYEELKIKLSVRAQGPRYAIYLRMVEDDLRAAANKSGGNKPVRVA